MERRAGPEQLPGLLNQRVCVYYTSPSNLIGHAALEILLEGAYGHASARARRSAVGLDAVIPDEAELTAGVLIRPGRSYGFFTDTTLCIGCKACEVACKEWNNLPAETPG